MVKLLLVDDNPDKIRRLLEAIRAVASEQQLEIDICYNARDAKLKLIATAYDALILDVALPEWADTQPSPECGIDLLRELSTRPQYKKPGYVLGLTAYPEALVQASDAFQQELWRVIPYDSTSSEWIDQIQRKVKYLLLVSQNPEKAEYDFDLCVITALDVPEYSAVMQLPWNWTVLSPANEVAIFHSGSFTSGGKTRRVVAGCASRMGMTSAAILATKAICSFRPRFLTMTGIAAGIDGKCNLGDIVVADPAWDYGSGKWAARGSDRVFEISPHQLPLNAALKSRFQLMARDSTALDQIRSAWLGPRPDSALTLRVGPMASGSAVRADGGAASEVQAQHRKALAIEMEAYGIMAAAHEAPLPEVRGFVLKSVCDFADNKKSDDYQAYAAYTSAGALRVFAENHLPFDQLP